MEPKYQLIVKVPSGMKITNLPRPKSQGRIEMRGVAVGTVLNCTAIINVDGVSYGQLVPQNPQKPEWIRIKDADMEYVDVIPLQSDAQTGSGDIAAAINRLATAVEALRK